MVYFMHYSKLRMKNYSLGKPNAKKKFCLKRRKKRVKGREEHHMSVIGIGVKFIIKTAACKSIQSHDRPVDSSCSIFETRSHMQF